MEHVKARRSELEEKALEIEENEDNHIAYLEAQLRGIIICRRIQKVKGAKVWKELGRVSPQLTMPPLTPKVPSTNQQVDVTNLVASMVQKREGSLTSAGIDQWSLIGRDDIKEKKDKKRHGKGEDKGKLSPRRVVQPGAVSSIGFIKVPPPLSPSRGDAASRLVPVVGGVGGHTKLEPPGEVHWKGIPHYLGLVGRDCELVGVVPMHSNQWINIASTKLEKGASSWFRAKKASIRTGD